MLLAFDMDGTLFDSRSLVACCYAQTLRELDLPFPAPDAETILAHVGKPVTEIIATLFPQATAVQKQAVADRGLQHIVAAIRRGEGLVFPGTADTLRALSAAGHTLAIVSNARPPYLRAIIETHGIADLFVFLGSVADAPPGGSKADILRRALTETGFVSAQALMIGDRAADYDAARACGVRFVACRYGHGTPDEWPQAVVVLDAVTNLPAAVARFAA